MIIYNVTVKIEAEAADEWVKWMKEEHMPELMKTAGCAGCWSRTKQKGVPIRRNTFAIQ